MRLQVGQIVASSMLAITILWVVCSLLVWIMPESAASMTAAMLHLEMQPSQWHLTFGGFLLGLGSWLLATSLLTVLVATFYNRLIK